MDIWIHNSKADDYQTTANIGWKWSRTFIKVLMKFSPPAQQYWQIGDSAQGGGGAALSTLGWYVPIFVVFGGQRFSMVATYVGTKIKTGDQN